MIAEVPVSAEVRAPEDVQAPRWRRISRRAEEMVVVVALGAMMVLPLAEIALRKFFHTGIIGSAAIVQHLVLLVGMLGGALAARERRLLALSTLTAFLGEKWKARAAVVSSGFAVAITAALCVAGATFVLNSRALGKVLAYGVPVWAIQLVMPVGFALIALRILWGASPKWSGRAIALAIAAVVLIVGFKPPVAPEHLTWIAIGLLLGSAVLGAPIFTVLGGAAVILFWSQGDPVSSVAIDHYMMTVNPSLPTIPLFTLAGYFLAEGGASRRLIRVFQALVGQFRGGPAVVTALVCAFFTSFTGASGVTILALGGLLMPVLLSAGYAPRPALGLLTGAGSLGLMFPPCLPLILYAVIASNALSNIQPGTVISLNQMFIAGLIPGALLVGLTAWWGIRQGARNREHCQTFRWSEARAALWDAKWELAMPVVALGALFSGWATPVEAAAVTALYAFIVETFVYRDLRLTRDVPRVIAECALIVGGVLLILGVAMGFTNYLVDAQIPDQAVDWVERTIHSRWVFLLALNFFLLIVGCLMDIFSSLIVVVPLIVPMSAVFGIDPVHLGIIFLANLELGYLTPPVGMNLFLSSYRFDKPVMEVARATLPMVGVLAVGVLLITYLPWLTTFLPGLLTR